MMLLAGLLLLLAGCSSPAAAAKLTDLQPAERTRTALLAKVAAGEAIAGLPAAQLTAQRMGRRWTSTCTSLSWRTTRARWHGRHGA